MKLRIFFISMLASLVTVALYGMNPEAAGVLRPHLADELLTYISTQLRCFDSLLQAHNLDVILTPLHEYNVECYALCPDGDHLALLDRAEKTYKRRILFWDIKNKKNIASLDDIDDLLSFLKGSHRGKPITIPECKHHLSKYHYGYCGMTRIKYYPQTDTLLEILYNGTSNIIRKSTRTTDNKSIEQYFTILDITNYDLHPQGTIFAYHDSKGTLFLYDLAQKKCIHSNDSLLVSALIFHKQDGNLIVGTRDGKIYIIDVNSFTSSQCTELSFQKIHQIALDPSGKNLTIFHSQDTHRKISILENIDSSKKQVSQLPFNIKENNYSIVLGSQLNTLILASKKPNNSHQLDILNTDLITDTDQNRYLLLYAQCAMQNIMRLNPQDSFFTLNTVYDLCILHHLFTKEQRLAVKPYIQFSPELKTTLQAIKEKYAKQSTSSGKQEN